MEEGRKRWRAAAQARLTLRVYSVEGKKKEERNELLLPDYQALSAITHCVDMSPHP